jgi:hypothetical protein
MNNRVRIMAGRIVLASAMTVTGAALPASAAADDVPHVVTVTGQGEVKVKPDMATITTGVTSEAPTAKAALAKNSSAMDSVLKALKAAGIDEDDIQTSDFSVSPVYAQVPQGQSGTPHIASYQVTNQVTARVKALSKLGTTLDALVQAGSNQISGVSFDLNDPKATLDEARRKAIRDAQDRASLYATAAGSSIGGVVQISETALHAPVFKAFSGREAMAYDGSVPIAAGQNTYSASITVTFELK